MRLPRAGGWPSGLRGFGSRLAEARQWRGLRWEEDGVGRGCLSRAVRRSGGGRFALLRLHQLAQLEVFFVSPGRKEGVLTAVYFVSLVAMLLRVVLIVFFGAVFRSCALLESEVLSTKSSTAAGSLGALEAMEPHDEVLRSSNPLKQENSL